MQGEIVYPNIYECLFDFKYIHRARFRTFTDTLRTKQDGQEFNTTRWEDFPRNMQIVQNHYTDETGFFSTETIAAPIGCRMANWLYFKQSEKYSAKRDRGLMAYSDWTRWRQFYGVKHVVLVLNLGSIARVWYCIRVPSYYSCIAFDAKRHYNGIINQSTDQSIPGSHPFVRHLGNV